MEDFSQKNNELTAIEVACNVEERFVGRYGVAIRVHVLLLLMSLCYSSSST